MAIDTSYEGRTLQLAMGFGQGAGILLATEGAVTTALNAYTEQLQGSGIRWERDALHAIEYSRVMGSLSAHHALSEGRCVIDVGDVEYALEAVKKNRVNPIGVCKISAMARG